MSALWIWLAGATAISGIAYLIASRDRPRHRNAILEGSGEGTSTRLIAQPAEVVERPAERPDTSERQARGEATGRFISSPLIEPRSSGQPKPPRRSGSR